MIALCNFTYEMPDKKVSKIQKCEAQNIRLLISKQTSEIPYDNIIIVDDQDQIYSSSTALQQTRLQGRNNLHYKIYDAQQLYKEYKKLIYLKNKILNKYNETQQEIKNLHEEYKKREINYQDQLEQISYQNIHIADILKTTQAEIERVTQQKTKELNQVIDQKNEFEQKINLMMIKIKEQEEEIKNLYTENDILQQQNQKYIIEIDKINKEKTIEIDKINNEKITSIKQWQIYFEQLKYQYCQQQSFWNECLSNIENQHQTDIQLKIDKQQKEYVELTQKNKEIQKVGRDLEDKLKDYETKIRSQEREIDRLKNELQTQITTSDNNVVNNEMTILSKEQAIKQYLNDIKTLKSKINNFENQIVESNIIIQNLQNNISRFSKERNKMNEQIERLEEQHNKNQEELEKNNRVLENLRTEIKNYKMQIQEHQQNTKIQIEEHKQIIQNLNREYENQCQNSKQEIKQLNNQLQTCRCDFNNAKNQIQELQQIKGEVSRTLLEKSYKISLFEIQQEQFKHQLIQKEKEKQEQKIQNEKNIEKHQKVISQYEQEIKAQQENLFKKQQIINILSKQIKDDRYHDKISSLIEKLMQSPNKINKFKEDQNVQLDDKEYEIYEIEVDINAAKSLLQKNQFFLFEQCLKNNHQGIVKVQRSIQSNAESTFFKGYLNSIKESTQNKYIGKYLLRKELISQTQPYIDINDAIQICKNNFLFQILMQQFKNICQNQGMECSNQQIAKQFILYDKQKKEYYYCEMVEEGDFIKINGGAFMPLASTINSFYNAFSKFVYYLSNQNFIITHLQICGNYVYDMIVSSTIKGLFSPLDQGQNEIEQFQQILEENPPAIIKSHWNTQIEEIAKNGFKYKKN